MSKKFLFFLVSLLLVPACFYKRQVPTVQPCCSMPISEPACVGDTCQQTLVQDPNYAGYESYDQQPMEQGYSDQAAPDMVTESDSYSMDQSRQVVEGASLDSIDSQVYDEDYSDENYDNYVYEDDAEDDYYSALDLNTQEEKQDKGQSLDLSDFVSHDAVEENTEVKSDDFSVDFNLDSQAPQEESGLEEDLEEVRFSFGSRQLSNQQKDTLNRNMSKIEKLAQSGHKIVVEGHACNSAGSDKYNMQISQNRAQKVADYLVEQGISKDNITVLAMGNTMPKVAYGDKNDQAPNRRVALHAYRQA